MSFTLNQFDANTAAPSTVTRSTTPTSTSSPGVSSPVSSGGGTTSASSGFNNSSTRNTDYNSTAFTTSWITYLAIIIVAGVSVATISSRYFYIRRYYEKPTFRAYFIPRKGIHIKWLGIHIRGPPERRNVMTQMTTMNEVYGASANQRGERRRRRRRNRQTVGETLGPGGARIGDGDEDDGWDGEDGDLEAGHSVGVRGERGDLPMYTADSGLPAYAAPPMSASTTEVNRLGGGGMRRTETRDEVDALPTAAEYEALSRGNRDGTNNNDPSTGAAVPGLPLYPPPVHVHGSNSLYPTEPPPSFSRANSGISTRSRRLPPPVGGVESTANDSRSTFESAGDDEDEEEQDRRERRRRTQEEIARRQSTATASSSASKLGDDEVDSVKDMNASRSKVTLGSSSSSTDTNNEKGPDKEQ